MLIPQKSVMSVNVCVHVQSCLPKLMEAYAE